MNKKQKEKVPGWDTLVALKPFAYGDRVCDLCKKYQGTKKNGKYRVMNWHHTKYPTELDPTEKVVKLCYTCHNLVHGRNKFHNPWEKAYGLDMAPLMFAYDIITLYQQAKTAKEVLLELEKNKKEEIWKKDVLRQG